MNIHQFFLAVSLFILSSASITVSAQDKPDLQKSVYPIQVAHMAFRPAKWEEKLITEEINEKRNEGGLLFVYYTNASENPVDFREWYLNDRESGHYRLAGDVAWDRRYTDVLQPGETTVQEICGVSNDFQTGKQADFSIIGRNWQPVCFYDGQLEDEKWRISSMTFDTTLSRIYIHIRSFISKTVHISSLSVLSKETASLTLTDTIIEGNGHVIAELGLNKPFIPGELAIVKLDLRQDGITESVYSHRNAYADYVPNGTWGIEEQQYEDAKQHHLNTMVRGGHSADLFFSKDFKTTGFRTMTHTGLYAAQPGRPPCRCLLVYSR
jgi:hypothetical protein